MKKSLIQPALMLIAGGLLAMSLTSCGSKARPSVKDFDTYYQVRIGSLEYIAPSDFEVVRTGKNSVSHAYTPIEGSLFRVEMDPQPPRSFRFDADAEKRRFVDSIPGGVALSAQYFAINERQQAKILCQGRDGDDRLYGILLIIREGKKTIKIKATGPYEQRDELNRLVESFASKLELSAS